jgi:hypothetical protein
MHLVQLLLPLRTNAGVPVPSALFERIRHELTERFGGVTAYARSPAEGAWRAPAGDVSNDDVVIVEVMCRELDRTFWAQYRAALTTELEQQELVVRALPIELL